jgi:hypothetical protein
MYGAIKKLSLILLPLTMVIFFQNCGKGFQPASNLADSSTLPSSVPALPPGPGVANADFVGCFNAAPADSTAISTCLNAKLNANAVYTAAQITTCFTAGNTTSLDLAYCLSQNGQVVQDYRPPKQTDIDTCVAAGATDVSFCLAKHGVRDRVTNDEITNCTNTAGATGVELCLHKNGFLPNPPNVFQADADFCNLIGGGTASLALCLFNSNLIPATVTQAAVDTCVTAAGEAGVVKCLRGKDFLPKAVMQADIDRCNRGVGEAKIAICLANQGLLPIDTTVAANITSFQTDIDNCVTAAGAAGVSKCLRKNNFLPNSIMQQQITSCFMAAGPANAFTCLSNNFPTLPANLTAVNLTACFAANGNTAANAAKCLGTKGALRTAPAEENLTECNFFAGQDPDGTGTLPGQIGIANCLANNGMLPTGVTQAKIDTCITNAGLAGAYSCLNNNGIIPSFAAMTATGGVFQANCASCHSAAVANGGLNISSLPTVLAKVVAGNSAASLLFIDVNNGTMPVNAAKLAPAQIAIIKTWIDQGANDN